MGATIGYGGPGLSTFDELKGQPTPGSNLRIMIQQQWIRPESAPPAMPRKLAYGRPYMQTKDSFRHQVYQRLLHAHVARFPFPIEGRIPNFKGAEKAAMLLDSVAAYRNAHTVKVGPDSPLLPARAKILRDGKTLLMPAPRLRAGFIRLTPERIPDDEFRRTVSLKHCNTYGEEITLEDIPRVDLVIAGSVAVTHQGARIGKGEGYSDLEYGILRDLGQDDIPTATLVHPLQIVDTPAQEFPVADHDLPLDFIVTPDEIIETNTPYPKPIGIDWERLDPDRIESMPALQQLRLLQWDKLTVPDIVKPGLKVLFVGLNPGRWTAARSHHFAGPGNHFWKLLKAAGFTPRLFAPEEDTKLLSLGYGITNVVARPTRGEDGLTWDELQAGGEALRLQVAQLRPKVIALLGRQVYRAYAGLSRSAAFDWGPQAVESVPGVSEFAAPNPSARSTIPFEERLRLFRQIYQKGCR